MLTAIHNNIKIQKGAMLVCTAVCTKNYRSRWDFRGSLFCTVFWTGKLFSVHQMTPPYLRTQFYESCTRPEITKKFKFKIRMLRLRLLPRNANDKPIIFIILLIFLISFRSVLPSQSTTTADRHAASTRPTSQCSNTEAAAAAAAASLHRPDWLQHFSGWPQSYNSELTWRVDIED